MIIAVDGPTASGKGTISRALAQHFHLPHLDTGLLYRAVGRQVALNGGNADNEADALKACEFPTELMEEPALRSEVTGGFASRVSVHPAVRKALFDRQRAFALQPGGAVLDGRDIGTVICPRADIKLFVTAAPEERARRRQLELRARGEAADFEAILADIRRRDERDTSRSAAPLKAAADAVVLDTTTRDADAVFDAALAIIDKARK